MGEERSGSSNRMSLAQHLRRAIRRSGLSVNQIAKSSDVDQSTLNKFVKGERNNLRLDVPDRLVRFLGIRIRPPP